MENIERKLFDYVDQHQDGLFTLLSDLIHFDTQNLITTGREKACAEHIRALYTTLGLETELYSPDDVPGIKEHPGYLPGRGLADRPNVSGILYGEDKSLGVMLAAHIDTMPVGDREKWRMDPFGGDIRDGRIYGLGAGDNKFGIAGGIFALQCLKAFGIRLKKTVVLTSYVDEEYGGGDGTLAACLKYPCKVFVNLDGGNYEMWVAGLGGCGYSIEVRTAFCTDTASQTVDALFRLISEIEQLGARSKDELHRNPLYRGTDMERSVYRLVEFQCGRFGVGLDTGSLKFVLYTTRSKADLEADLAGILERLSPYFKAHGLVTDGFTPTTRFFDYHETVDRTGAVDTMKKAAEEVSGEPVRTTGACLSDLSLFLSYGSMESFNFGIMRDFSLPGGAHQPNEYIECAQFVNHTKAMILFLQRYCGIAGASEQ